MPSSLFNIYVAFLVLCVIDPENTKHLYWQIVYGINNRNKIYRVRAHRIDFDFEKPQSLYDQHQKRTHRTEQWNDEETTRYAHLTSESKYIFYKYSGAYSVHPYMYIVYMYLHTCTKQQPVRPLRIIIITIIHSLCEDVLHMNVNSYIYECYIRGTIMNRGNWFFIHIIVYI